MDDKNQPGFVLKSNGSECLMIHKKVYRDLIKDDFDLKEKLRSDVSTKCILIRQCNMSNIRNKIII